MTLAEQAGIRRFRRISQHTVVVEHLDGKSCHPATDLELRLWLLLGGVVDGVPERA